MEDILFKNTNPLPLSSALPLLGKDFSSGLLDNNSNPGAAMIAGGMSSGFEQPFTMPVPEISNSGLGLDGNFNSVFSSNLDAATESSNIDPLTGTAVDLSPSDNNEAIAPNASNLQAPPSKCMPVPPDDGGGSGHLPDLQVTISAPNSATPGSDISPIEVKVKNVGNAIALGTESMGADGYMVDLILSSDTEVPKDFATYSPNYSEDVLLQGGRLSNTPDLAPGEEFVFTAASGGIPADTPSGNYYLAAQIDPGQKITESDEGNNTSFVPLEISTTSELDGTGLTGRYYDNPDFTAFRGRRTDATVDFDWGSGSPSALTEPDTFSVRWTGQVKPQYSETYTFSTQSNDGVRLWVNGELLIDNWTDHTLTQDSGTITLTAGQKYDIKLEYYENDGDAAMQLLWSSPSQPLEIVPQNRLYLDPNELPLDPETGFEYKPDELLVKFKSDVTDDQVQSVAQANGAIGVERLVPLKPNSSSPLDQWRVLKFAPEANLPQIRHDLTEDASVDIAGFDYKLSLDAVPNDPQFDQLWGLNNTGMAGGKPDADIDAPEAWNIQTGNKSAIVAVIDSGIDYNHPDLAANIWKNPGEIPNGIDDDGNGYIDDIHGYDFAQGDSEPTDRKSHGTHVAGTIGAVGNNNLGVVGVSQNVSLMSLKITENYSHGIQDIPFLKHALRAIDYATSMGARVINASWGLPQNFWVNLGTEVGEFLGVTSSLGSLTDAIKRANNAQVLFVASAGNDGENIDANQRFPSSLNLPNVITVAATDRNDQLASFSNFGSKTADLGAPGVDILSTIPGNGFDFKNGTSMAAPHVAGAAALVLSESPLLTAAEVRNILMTTTDPLPSLQGKTVSGGRLNVHKALVAVKPEQRVGLTIHRVREVDNIEPDNFFGKDDHPDFYTRVTIAGQEFPRTTPNVTGSVVNPNWRFFKTVPTTASTVPITIKIFDDDGGLRGNDDHVDINPRRGAKDLLLTYNLFTDEVFDSVTGVKFQRNRDGQFQLRGAFDDDKGEIWFSLTHS